MFQTVFSGLFRVAATAVESAITPYIESAISPYVRKGKWTLDVRAVDTTAIIELKDVELRGDFFATWGYPAVELETGNIGSRPSGDYARSEKR